MPLYVAEHGPESAPTIVFLHAGGVGGWTWRTQVESLSLDYHCLVPDLPEHGHSRGDGPFTINSAARRIAELIHTRAHGGRAHVVGHSLGAQVAVALLGLAPALVDRAVVSSALLRPQPFAGLTGLTLKLYAPLKDRDFLIRLNQRSLGIPAPYAAEFAADTRAATSAALARVLRANLSFCMPPGLSRLANPTLALVGEKEPRVMRQSARDLVSHMPGATARLVPSVRGNWNLTAPRAFTRIVRDWLAGQPLPEALKVLRAKMT